MTPPPPPPGPGRLALAGGALVIPAGLLQAYLGDPLVAALPAQGELSSILVRAFLVTALVEEGAKCGVLHLWGRGPPRPPRHWLIAGLAVGLGFGLVEALLVPGAWVAALLFAVPSHMLDGVLLGTAMARPGGTRAGLALVVALHGAWDTGVFLLEAGPEQITEATLDGRTLLGVVLVLGVFLLQWILGVRRGLAAYRGARGAGASEGAGPADAGEATGPRPESSGPVSAEAEGSSSLEIQR